MPTSITVELDALDMIMSACLLLRKKMIDLAEWERCMDRYSKEVKHQYGKWADNKLVRKGL